MIVKENINFERGQDPRDAMEIGNVDKRELERNIDQFLHAAGLLNEDNHVYTRCLEAANQIKQTLWEEYNISSDDDNMDEERMDEIRAKIEKIFKNALDYHLR
jgi:hypothetical protein